MLRKATFIFMQPTEYAYGVARIRANELSLLSPSDIEQLISSRSYESALRITGDKGWDTSYAALSEMLEKEAEKTWQLLGECAPDISLLEALVTENDFYNLKAAIKATVSGHEAAQYMAAPFSVEPKLIMEAVQLNSFDSLPLHMQGAAKSAYEAVSAYESGMLADIRIDKACLEAKAEMSKKAQSPLLEKICAVLCGAANVKIALRGTTGNKSREFIREAMVEGGPLEQGRLIECAAKGAESVADYLSGTLLSPAASALKKSLTEFERKCDLLILSLLKSAAYETFGPDPLVAYYYNREFEIKNVRIILSAKLNGYDESMIRDRIRI